jgi:hypothetical protein
VQAQRLHPVDRPVLQPLMLLCLVVGAVSGIFYDTSHGSLLSGAVAILSFACFLVLFALYWLGWLLREHDLWREGRRQGLE